MFAMKRLRRVGILSSPDDAPQQSFSRSGFSSQTSRDACYACTRPEIPCFHSDSCEQNHSPLWEANAGSSLGQHEKKNRTMPSQDITCKHWMFGAVHDPRRKLTQTLNKWCFLARSVALAVDPLFFYVLIINTYYACVYMDGVFAILVTSLRTACDAIHLVHIWLQLKSAYVSRESLVVGRGSLVWDARKIALHYLRPGGGFWFDLFVILPIPQVVFWVAVPFMIREGQTLSLMILLLIMFLFQYIPKVYHVICLARRMRHVTGFVFGTVWWGFALNLSAYFIAAHASGGCWYLLTVQRTATCLITQCQNDNGCDLRLVGCSQPISYRGLVMDMPGYEGNNNQTVFSSCYNGQSGYPFGIYSWAVALVTEQSWSTKILYPIFWGIMTLSSFGNALTPSNHSLEAAFCIIVITCGLLLFTLLIGNIQVFLQSITSKKEAMKIRIRDLEWWMRRRQLPARLRHRVRRYEWHHWAATRGIDEEGVVQALPEGLRRDIKRHLCLDLVRQVPLFEKMDNLVLDNICDRLRPHLFIKGETVIREGDPVQRMLFVVRGHLHSSHQLSNGQPSICYLGPGNFCGDELLSWCLRRPFVERMPPSSATLTSIDSTEAFGLEAQDLKYVTEHFRFNFENENLKRTARYYSSGWRTWAAVTIQIAWKRYMTRKSHPSPSTQLYNIRPRLSSRDRSESEHDRLRFYAAMFSSPKPQDHLE